MSVSRTVEMTFGSSVDINSDHSRKTGSPKRMLEVVFLRSVGGQNGTAVNLLFIACREPARMRRGGGGRGEGEDSQRGR